MNWHEYFAYDELTGNLIWKERPLRAFSTEAIARRWNTIYSGKIAGHEKHQNGIPVSIEISLSKKATAAHRIIWEMHNGPIPDGVEIDHKDGNPLNNRRYNIRLATKQQNRQNRRLSKASASGYKGVWWDAKQKRWLAYIGRDGKTVKLGRFVRKEDAALRYNEEAIKCHGEYARLNEIKLP